MTKEEIEKIVKDDQESAVPTHVERNITNQSNKDTSNPTHPTNPTSSSTKLLPSTLQNETKLTPKQLIIELLLTIPVIISITTVIISAIGLGYNGDAWLGEQPTSTSIVFLICLLISLLMMIQSVIIMNNSFQSQILRFSILLGIIIFYAAALLGFSIYGGIQIAQVDQSSSIAGSCESMYSKIWPESLLGATQLASTTLCTTSCPCNYSEESQTSYPMDGEFSDSGVLNASECTELSSLSSDDADLLKSIEEEWNCAGICEVSNKYLFSDVNRGQPNQSSSCFTIASQKLYPLRNYFFEANLPLAFSLIILSIMLIYIKHYTNTKEPKLISELVTNKQNDVEMAIDQQPTRSRKRILDLKGKSMQVVVENKSILEEELDVEKKPMSNQQSTVIMTGFQSKSVLMMESKVQLNSNNNKTYNNITSNDVSFEGKPTNLLDQSIQQQDDYNIQNTPRDSQIISLQKLVGQANQANKQQSSPILPTKTVARAISEERIVEVQVAPMEIYTDYNESTPNNSKNNVNNLNSSGKKPQQNSNVFSNKHERVMINSRVDSKIVMALAPESSSRKIESATSSFESTAAALRRPRRGDTSQGGRRFFKQMNEKSEQQQQFMQF